MAATAKALHVHTKRLLVGILAAVIALAGCMAAGLHAYAAELTDVDVYWYLDDPDATEYELLSTAELNGLAALVNGTAVDDDGESIPAVNFKGVTIKQRSSMVLSPPGAAREWTPIGIDEEHAFAGTYDGQGNTLRGFKITEKTENVGLFGVTAAGSSLKNISLTTSSMYSSSINLYSSTAQIANVGTVVGKARGTVENCTSTVPVTIESDAASAPAAPYPVKNVGGIAGYILSDLSGCMYRGELNLKSTADSLTDDLGVIAAVGGIVGRAGDPHTHGDVRSCTNRSTVWVLTTGAGSTDRFGIATYARSLYVGGVVGYSNSCIYDCVNGVYDTLYGTASGYVQTSATSPKGTPRSNRGGDEVGGICGSLRGESEDPNRYNDGDPNDPMVIQNCRNLGTVVGCCATGGICGQAGVYCTVTQSRNGMPEEEYVGHVVSTRWNKPSTAGVLGQGRGGGVSYCANYAMVENIQTGYYTSGIVGSLYYSDDYRDADFQVFSCFNSGHIYTANRDEDAEFREAGLVGYNEGYVHDSVMLYGTVPYHDDSPIGANDWGMTSNLYVLDQAQMQSSYCAALLNSTNTSWDVYWYMNSSGYPVLNIWEDPAEHVALTPELIKSVEVTEDAGFVGPGIEPVPQIAVTLTNGRKLWQNTDFYVVPQEGAWDVSRVGERPYWASIVGLGIFEGRVDNVVQYGIGKGDLSGATVLASNGKYALGRPVWPEKVRVLMAGADLEPDSYSYVIYDYATTSLDDARPHYVVFDSDGYATTSANPEMVPVFEADLSADYVLYDRNGAKISDSDARVYDPATGLAVNNRYSCCFYRSGNPAGYIIEVKATSGAVKYTGSAYGHYSVSTASFKDDITIEHIYVAGEEWFWDDEAMAWYKLDENGNATAPSITFTGEQIRPDFVMSYMGHTLVRDEDYRMVYGNPYDEESYYNRDVTDPNDELSAAGAIVRSADSAKYSNYLTNYFQITPAALEDCDISLEGYDIDSEQHPTYAFTGYDIAPDVDVMLNGVKLVAGRDYDIAFANNARRGTATYTITARDNLKGGKVLVKKGIFEIDSGIDIAQFDISDPPETYYNFGEDPKVDLTFTDAQGEEVPLRYGEDYTLDFSFVSVGTATVTVRGAGAYGGSVAKQLVIRPYDVVADPYGQVEVTTQSIAYGTWKPDYASTLPIYNISSSCPASSVRFYPITNWQTMERGEPLTQRSGSSKIGSLSAYYFNSNGVQVNYLTAQPGPLTVEVRFAAYEVGYSNMRVGCTGTIVRNVELTEPVDIATGVTWSTEGDCTYTGETIEPVVAANPGSGNRLRLGRDYTVEYSNNVNSGIARYTATAVEGSGYSGTYSGTFPVLPQDLTTLATVKKLPTFAYTGRDVCPEPLVRVYGKTLTLGTDYTLSYIYNVEPGRGRVYITGKGNYGGRTSVEFAISKDGGEISYTDISGGSIEGLRSLYEYSGEEVRPPFTVKIDGYELQEGVDYEAAFEDNVQPGIATITVTGIGSCTGTISANFEIDAEVPPAPEPKSFKDVKKGDWYYDVVQRAVSAAIMSGFADNTFRPNQKVTRAQMAVILYNASGQPQFVSDKSFKDVSASSWYGRAVLWCASTGVVTGYSDGNFKPDNNITRQDLCVMLARYAQYCGAPAVGSQNYRALGDASSVASYAGNAVGWAYDKGIIGSNGRLNPKGNATRAEACAMVLRSLDAIAAEVDA